MNKIFTPLRHPDGELKRGYINVLFKDVTIIYYSPDGKSSLSPFDLQRSNLFKVFTKEIPSIVVSGISFDMNYESPDLARVRIDYVEYEKDSISENTTAEQEIKQAKDNGTWVGSEKKIGTNGNCPCKTLSKDNYETYKKQYGECPCKYIRKLKIGERYSDGNAVWEIVDFGIAYDGYTPTYKLELVSADRQYKVKGEDYAHNVDKLCGKI